MRRELEGGGQRGRKGGPLERDAKLKVTRCGGAVPGAGTMVTSGQPQGGFQASRGSLCAAPGRRAATPFVKACSSHRPLRRACRADHPLLPSPLLNTPRPLFLAGSWQRRRRGWGRRAPGCHTRASSRHRCGHRPPPAACFGNAYIAPPPPPFAWRAAPARVRRRGSNGTHRSGARGRRGPPPHGLRGVGAKRHTLCVCPTCTLGAQVGEVAALQEQLVQRGKELDAAIHEKELAEARAADRNLVAMVRAQAPEGSAALLFRALCPRRVACAPGSRRQVQRPQCGRRPGRADLPPALSRALPCRPLRHNRSVRRTRARDWAS